MQSFIIPTDETADDQKRRMLQAQMEFAGNMPRDAASGMQSVAQALMLREQARQSQFPGAPGGGKPSFGTRISNMFGLGGGLH